MRERKHETGGARSEVLKLIKLEAEYLGDLKN